MLVALIIGIFSAIALSALLGGRDDGQDSVATRTLRRAEAAISSCYVSVPSYARCAERVRSDFARKEPRLAVTASRRGYLITMRSKSGHLFRLIDSARGKEVLRTCAPAGKGGCDSGGSW